MLVTGNQIRAARALLGWTRGNLARAARLHPNAVAYWESRTDIPAGGWRTPGACRQMREALLEAGVDFLMLPAIGVRLVATHNFARTTRKRARARHGVIEPPARPHSQNSCKTLPAAPQRQVLPIRCGAKTRSGTPCLRKALANGRCRNHGGLSSGPKTPAGRHRIAEAQKRRWARQRAPSQPRASVTDSSETSEKT